MGIKFDKLAEESIWSIKVCGQDKLLVNEIWLINIDLPNSLNLSFEAYNF